MQKILHSIFGFFLIQLSYGLPDGYQDTEYEVPTGLYTPLDEQLNGLGSQYPRGSDAMFVEAIPATPAIRLSSSEAAALEEYYLRQMYESENSARLSQYLPSLEGAQDNYPDELNAAEMYAALRMASPYYAENSLEKGNEFDDWYTENGVSSFEGLQEIEIKEDDEAQHKLGANMNMCMSFLLTSQKIPAILGNVFESAVKGSHKVFPIMQKIYECSEGNMKEAYNCLTKFEAEVREIVLTIDGAMGPVLKQLSVFLVQAKKELNGCLEIP